VNRFTATFSRLKSDGACGLFPYLMAGDPDVETSYRLADAAIEAGADGFEIGVPFSDPLADGATMQRANERALAGGATFDTALDLVRFIRDRADVPIAPMSYYNVLRQRSEARVAVDLAGAGADGLIVPDMPVEESRELGDALRSRDIGLIPFLAPTSNAARIAAVARLDPVCIYCVALIGVTGARQNISSALGDFLGNVRAATSAPLLVGFGISRPDHVREAARRGGDGVIVASALTDLVERSDTPIDAAREYLREMKQAATAVAR
jgi:tryptophan synthase alpha chain